MDEREHLNVVVIGHVNAGKSTTCGSILLDSGAIDKHTIEQYKKEAKHRKCESWYLAYIMDTTEEEREKGITMDVGSANFSTSKRRFTLLDAPGHKDFVPRMIAGASHADVGILVVSAQKGEFESGFEKQGQTREHAILTLSLGIHKLIVAVNKMDCVGWSKERFDYITEQLFPFLRGCGYRVKKDVVFVPIASALGAGVVKSVECEWAEHKSLVQILETVEIEDRNEHAPIRVCVVDSTGTDVSATVKNGTLRVDQIVHVSPTENVTRIESIFVDGQSVDYARPGENVSLKLDPPGCKPGDMLSDERFGKVAFKAMIRVVDVVFVLTKGYPCVLHVNGAMSDCTVAMIWNVADGTKRTFAKNGDTVYVRLNVQQPVAVESGMRLTLRSAGRTIAIGKVVPIIS